MMASTLRVKALDLCRRLRALLVATNTLTPDQRDVFERNIRTIPSLPRSQLESLMPKLRKHVRDVEQTFGFSGSYGRLGAIVEYTPRTGPYVFVRKSELDGLFMKYDRALESYAKFPPHARISLDPQGIRQPGMTPEVFLLEASVFEDVAMLWNALSDSSLNTRDRMTLKRAGALRRAAVKCCFNLLEAYLNGMAADVVLTRDNLTDDDLVLLREWDGKRTVFSP